MNLAPTKWSLLVALGVLTTVFGWSLARLWVNWYGMELNISWLVPLTMVLLALTLVVWTLMVRQRMKPENIAHRLHPLVAARTAALAMAASRVGSLTSGFYLGVLFVNIVNYASPAAADRVVICGATVVASLVTSVVALWLERMCQLPQPPAES